VRVAVLDLEEVRGGILLQLLVLGVGDVDDFGDAGEEVALDRAETAVALPRQSGDRDLC
jgi:hypothetical protein